MSRRRTAGRVQDEEARRPVGWRRERVRRAGADVHEATLGDRGYPAQSAHEQHRGQDEEGLIAGAVDMQRRPAGGGGDSAGDDAGGASRGAGQDDFQRTALAPDGRALLWYDGGHVMALLRYAHLRGPARAAEESRSRRIAGLTSER